MDKISGLKIYTIGGLGADERVFNEININSETKSIRWIDPKTNESLKSYVKRLSNQINQNENFGILGVSFGGIIAVELSKMLKPKITILISSASNKYELKSHLISLGKLGVGKLISFQFLKPPFWITKWLFSAKNKKLLKEIIDDTDPKFAKWAITQIINWDNTVKLENLIQLHGTADKLIPLNNRNCIQIENGGHFMIVDKADEISKLINEQIEYAG